MDGVCRVIAEIITIGDELISGRVRDRNAEFVAGRLFGLGVRVRAITTVADDLARIQDALTRAVRRSDLVLVTGGLGPTEDDVTCAAAAEVGGVPLVRNEAIWLKIKGYLELRGRGESPERYEKLAVLPQGAEIIDPRGNTCGFSIIVGGVPVFLLPGVPEQTRDLMDAQVIPFLSAGLADGSVLRQRLIKTFGLDETAIQEKLAPLAADWPGVSLGYYPDFPEVHLMLTAQAKDENEAAALITRAEGDVRRVLGKVVYGREHDRLESVVGELLAARGRKLAVAESCTGGLIGHRLTGVPGSSEYVDRVLVTYSNQAKVELLGVSGETLEKHGAVSAETAVEMAAGVRERSAVDLGLAVTGIAGPDGGTDEKPVGTVFIALGDAQRTAVRRHRFMGRRHQIKILSAAHALDWLRRYFIQPGFMDS
ncbi:MAG: competence/damage-inducible protein A [Proteobacteria bacterium]|nr:competence/damage-inducible protein A [Pseudomonadota bacterium]